MNTDIEVPADTPIFALRHAADFLLHAADLMEERLGRDVGGHARS